MKTLSNRRSNRETTRQYHISGNRATKVREGMLSQKATSCTMYSEKKVKPSVTASKTKKFNEAATGH